jgi:hypothetical protein
MKCKVDGCKSDLMYVEQKVCQKHYFRFMRNGSYDLKRSKKYRYQNPAGYELINEPNHPLSGKNGYVYEHRFVYYNEVNAEPYRCELCEDSINWSNLHIDHIDNDVSNNKKENLRALCRVCNTFRGHTAESLGKDIFEINGRRLTAFAWARQPDVIVSGATILRRRRLLNMSDYDCVYAPRVTHHKTKTKTGKKERKYDKVRGIN